MVTEHVAGEPEAEAVGTNDDEAEKLDEEEQDTQPPDWTPHVLHVATDALHLEASAVEEDQHNERHREVVMHRPRRRKHAGYHAQQVRREDVDEEACTQPEELLAVLVSEEVTGEPKETSCEDLEEIPRTERRVRHVL